METKKRLVITSLVLSSALLLGTVGTTVAWFAGSPYLEYNNINIGISDKNIEISDDDINWESSLDSEDLGIVDNFRPISSMFSNEWLKSKKTTPEFRNGFTTADKQFMNDSAKASIASTGYFSHAIYLKSDADAYITVDPEKTYFVPNEEKNKAIVKDLKLYYPELTEEQILDNLNSINKSLRMSILVLNNSGSELLKDYKYYIVEPYKDRDTLFGGVLDMDENKYYDSVGDYEAVYGDLKNTDKAVYDEPSEYDGTIEGEYSVFNAKTMRDVHHFNLDASLENGFEIANENSIALEDANKEIFIPLEANTSRKLIISFYMEGWDLDNTNVTMYSNFIINVSFMIATNRAE
ncbi:MAG: hypothetical protein MJ248_03895 [Bacilli bacterium]|nr:hypothetical protein [Bacilli bacterium]